ncbi:hypothetical protein HN371_11805 [Candidatus Poribacteria bacterium]|jgi:hypothetical protein|nr:hypothetical protein [Candidatus Poribacteria bacterium]MBT5532750.1 hypothetical protein [Candidatus Poribacteria bacterium]MBT5709661.1 hypothetical protein [Candidatus Poribacteria bacterium]MBT7099102.1 hypothetical protein [Candidatus Poribacteria bacterium]MBT7804318.1 hypothetical protein [Candidatus Poribacteria bacterium]
MPARSDLPARPNIEQLKNQAKDLRASHGSGSPESIPRLRDHLPSLSGASDAAVLAAKFSLLDAQLVVAREYGFDNWHMLAEHVESLAHPPTPIGPDADPKTRRVERLVRDGLMSPREAEYVLAGTTHWLRDDMTLAGEYTDRQLEFMDAAMIRGPRMSDTCDVERLRAMLAEDPELIETAGPAALAKALTKKGSLPAVEFLIRRGVPRLTLNPLEHNELSEAAYGDNIDGLRMVFDAGFADASDIQHRWAHSGWPAHVGLLFWARREAEMTELLLDHGADRILEVPDRGGLTPLQHIVYEWDGRWGRWEGNFPAGRLYLERGAYYDVFSACGFDDVERVRELIEEDSSCVNARHANGSAPLHWAARQSSYACAELLLNSGAEVDPVYPSLGFTPFHWAVNSELIHLLLDHGANINAQDKKGRTKLHHATSINSRDQAEDLMALGADVTLRNAKGKTAFDVAGLHCAYLRPTKSGERRWPGPDVPQTVFEIAELPGLGMKTVRALYERHDVQSLDDVQRMVNDGSLATVKGISEKTFDSIRVVFELAAILTAERMPDCRRMKIIRLLVIGHGVHSVEDIVRLVEDGTLAQRAVEGIGIGEYKDILDAVGIDY